MTRILCGVCVCCSPQGVKTQYPFSIGLVKLRDLWKEVVWDARTCYESSHMAKDSTDTLDGPLHLKKEQ